LHFSRITRPLILELTTSTRKFCRVFIPVVLLSPKLYYIFVVVVVVVVVVQDISDLFGADLPVEGKSGAHFEWRDGPFLKALKYGNWVVFDEVRTNCARILFLIP